MSRLTLDYDDERIIDVVNPTFARMLFITIRDSASWKLVWESYPADGEVHVARFVSVNDNHTLYFKSED